MNTYASDVAALTDALDLKGAVHIGHSTGGGEAAHCVARAKPGRVAKLVLAGAVPPVMIKSSRNPVVCRSRSSTSCAAYLQRIELSSISISPPVRSTDSTGRGPK